MPDYLLPLQFIVSGGFWRTLIICLVICPITPMLLGLVFESRWVPLSPRYQFLAFFPGNPFLALFIAGCSTSFDTPSANGFWQQRGVQYALLVGAIIVYIALNVMDLTSNYTREQMVSATKVYHNALYLWYGYLAVSSFVALLASQMEVYDKILPIVPGVLWLACLVSDSVDTPKEVLAVRFKTAHTNNQPIWKTWKFRHLDGPNGYRFRSSR